jgi:hypothetical protein
MASWSGDQDYANQPKLPGSLFQLQRLEAIQDQTAISIPVRENGKMSEQKTTCNYAARMLHGP